MQSSFWRILSCFLLHYQLGDNSRIWFFRTFTRMLKRKLLSSRILSLRSFSSEIPRVLKPGDVLRKTRIFTDDDVLQYSKVSHDSNPLHFDSEAARNVGFEGRLVHGMLVASLFPHIISSHFVSLFHYPSLNFVILLWSWVINHFNK